MVYINSEDWEELYDLKKKELRELEKFQKLPIDTEGESVRIIEKEKIIPHRRDVSLTEDEDIKRLKKPTPEIIGSLFDRLGFLKERIEETKNTMKVREQLHNEMLAEIDADIKERMDMESKVADFDEKRNLRLDISVLRKEKRRENIQFWRDMTELRSELKELMEKHQVEAKISGIFDNLRGGKNEQR